MKFVSNCFLKKENSDYILFNPFFFATVIIPNYGDINEDEFAEKLNPNDREVLLNNDIMIADDNHAHAISKYFSDSIKYGKVFTISDLYSYKCNMNCIYCFENKQKEKVSRIPEYLRIEGIKRLINIYGDKFECLDYIFFGGEPLLNLNYIDSCAKSLIEVFTDKKILFSATSNGTLINDSFVEICNRYHFDEIRITLDGPDKVNDERRLMKNGKGSYSMICGNIMKLCTETNVRIVINTVLDNNNYDYYLKMFDDLVARFERFIICEEPRIVFNLGMLCHPMVDTSYSIHNSRENWYGDKRYYELSKAIVRKGATITSPLYATHCLNSIEKGFVLSPNGDIYKCITGTGSDRFLLANISDLNEETFTKNNIYQIESSHRATCYSCEFLSMCNGGCKCQYYENNDALCRKKLLTDEMSDLLDLLYEGHFTEDGLFRRREL